MRCNKILLRIETLKTAPVQIVKESLHWSYIDKEKKTAMCNLCPHNCRLSDGKIGVCRVRQNVGGKLYTHTYGRFASVNIDPIEKKPLYHFYPGSGILSVGTLGCNFRCLHCQNWGISQSGAGGQGFKGEGLRELSSGDALRLAKTNNSIGIAYTYNEPLINYEWTLETAEAFRSEGLKNVLVTNGYINEPPWTEILKWTDAANIDVKAFSDNFYKKVCGGRLEPVLRSAEIMHKAGKHLELTYLIIPGENDTNEEIKKFVDWVAGLDDDIPVHFSRYTPQYRMSAPATPLETMETARKTAMEKLKYVYLGNVWEQDSGSTCCPGCGNLLIERTGYTTEIKGLSAGGRCRKCNAKINIVLEEK
ncbi:MAG: AmmeMemoRadiSam system radical SAM enzyme [Elusimicrobia bacterium]|nr:AmmeMemoRadiSam system radical SAM enzyme [Elusimicrobiota bacterium]